MKRLYHIVAIIEKSGDTVFMTRYPMDHKRACTMLHKFSKQKARTLQLMEIKQ